MVSSEKILTAARSNWWLNALGMAVSFCATIVLVRTLAPELYTQYAAVLAMVWLCTLVFEAGGNSGLTRYMVEAGRANARGSFYSALRLRRWLIALVLSGAVIGVGPWYAGVTGLTALAEDPSLFIPIAGIAVASLTRGLAHYGMIALFETRSAVLWEQGFGVLRAIVIMGIALLGGALWHLVFGLLSLHVLEAACADRRLCRLIGQERDVLPTGFVRRAQAFGLLTVFDKVCANVGSGPVLLLVFAPFHEVGVLALLALAIEFTGKVISLTVMPMGNLVLPYLGQVSDDPAAQGRAVASVVKLSSLLYGFSVGFTLLLTQDVIPILFGMEYSEAISFVLLLLVPLAFENWVRGVSSPALLRNGYYRWLATLNVVQACVTLAAIWLVYSEPLLTAVTIVVVVRAAISALSLLPLREIAMPGVFRVPIQTTVLVAVAVAPWFVLDPLPLPAVPGMFLKGCLFALIYYAGLRWVVLRDNDMLQLAHRLVGRSSVACLLPSMPC